MSLRKVLISVDKQLSSGTSYSDVKITEESTGMQYRPLGSTVKILGVLCSLTVIGIVIFNIFSFNIRGRVFVESGYYFILIALLLPWTFLFLAPHRRGIRAVQWYDILAAVLAFIIPFYFFVVSYDVGMLGWDVQAPQYVQIISLILVILVFEAVRRAIGIAFTLVCVFFAFFPLFASHMPPPFYGLDFKFWRTISFHVMGSESFLGIPMQVVANLVFGFLIFAVALMATGGGSFFLNLALSTLGHVRGGPAKVAVIASALFGSISGSAVANVLTTGCITIPTMKKTGYPPYYAGAVEACASTGGVLMPPVMGAAAFIIAQFLGMPYIYVAMAATLPSILYYLGLFVQADAFAAKSGIRGLDRKSLPHIKQTLKEGWYYIIAIIILLWLLLYLGRTGQAPFVASAALIVLSMLRKETRLTPRRFIKFLLDSLRTLSELMSTMLGVGFIIGSLSMTGIAHSFSSEVIALSGGNVALLLALGALTSFILGMGMSVTACYVFLAVLLAPALVAAGLYPLGVHLFILYWGMISFITPPVAVAAIVAASIAGASPNRTGFQAMRLGIVIYFIPFFFIIEPALLLHGTPVMILESFITAVFGTILIASAVEGYLVKVGVLNPLLRITLAIAGILLAYPNWITSVTGAAIAAFSISMILLRRRSESRMVKTGN